MGSPFSWTGPRQAAGQRGDLVRRAKSGDRAAFGELFDLHVGRVFEYLAYQLDGQAELAQQLTEQVFFQALQGLRDCPTDLPFSSWLYRIAASRLGQQAAGGWEALRQERPPKSSS